MARSIRRTQPAEDDVAVIIRCVRKGEVTGTQLCAQMTRLDPLERHRLVGALLREYKDVNNFTPNTAMNDAAGA